MIVHFYPHYDARKPITFRIKGTVLTHSGNMIHTVDKVNFSLQCLICCQYLTIKHKNIEIIRNKFEWTRTCGEFIGVWRKLPTPYQLYSIIWLHLSFDEFRAQSCACVNKDLNQWFLPRMTFANWITVQSSNFLNELSLDFHDPYNYHR